MICTLLPEFLSSIEEIRRDEELSCGDWEILEKGLEDDGSAVYEWKNTVYHIAAKSRNSYLIKVSR